MWTLLLPAAISSSVGTLAVIIGTYFCSMLPAGGVGIYDYANKLVQLPLGIMMTALLIPLFPLLTQAAVAGDREALFLWLRRGLITIAVGMFPLVAFFMAAGVPFVRLLYQHGVFDETATRQTANILAIIAMGIVPYAMRYLFVRVFYALDDGRTPLMISCAALGATALAMAAVVGPLGLPGLALAGVAVTTANCLAVGALLRRKLGELRLGDAPATSARALIAATLAGGAAWWVGTVMPGAPGVVNANAVDAVVYGGPQFGADVRLLVAQAALLGLVYGASLAALGLPVRATVLDLLNRRRGRPAAQPGI